MADRKRDHATMVAGGVSGCGEGDDDDPSRRENIKKMMEDKKKGLLILPEKKKEEEEDDESDGETDEDLANLFLHAHGYPSRFTAKATKPSEKLLPCSDSVLGKLKSGNQVDEQDAQSFESSHNRISGSAIPHKLPTAPARFKGLATDREGELWTDHPPGHKSYSSWLANDAPRVMRESDGSCNSSAPISPEDHPEFPLVKLPSTKESTNASPEKKQDVNKDNDDMGDNGGGSAIA